MPGFGQLFVEDIVIDRFAGFPLELVGQIRPALADMGSYLVNADPFVGVIADKLNGGVNVLGNALWDFVFRHARCKSQ